MSNDKLEPKEDNLIIRPYEPDITKGFTSSAPPPKPEVTTAPTPKEEK
jgi:hypothetical protein